MIVRVMLKDKTIVPELLVADKFTARLVGLMFKKSLPGNSGLMIPKCNWVHTLFMRFPLDIVYLNKDLSVCHIDEDISPWRFCLPVIKAENVLELNAGTVEAVSLKKGDVLKCIN